MLFGIVLFLLVWTTPAVAQEAWCLANPGNCVCSEPLTASSWAETVPGSQYYRPSDADSRTKLCNFGSNNEGWSLWDATSGGGNPPSPASDPDILALMPNRTNVPRYLSGAPGMIGNNFLVGVSETSLTNVKRMAARWYLYRSPDFQDAYVEQANGLCTNAKTVQAYTTAITGPAGFNASSYQSDFFHPSIAGSWVRWSGITEDVDCCIGAQAPMFPVSIGSSAAKGHWLRVEAIVHHPQANDPGWDFEVWITNVTDQGAPQKAFQFSLGCASCGQGNRAIQPDAASMYITSQMASLGIFVYHAVDPVFGGWGTCAGYDAVSYYVLATWTTDSGQMIGAASEVEGGGGGPIYDGTMTLTVSSIFVFLTIGLGITGFLGLVRLLSRRKQYVVHRGATGQGDSDPGVGEPVRPVPLDGSPAAGERAIQPVVSPAPADELVGAGREIEGRG